MRKASVHAVVKALNDAGVRYLVVGGLAVNAYGIPRFTADMDVVIRLTPENIRKAFAALAKLGFRPMVPVTAESFADTPTREGWIRDKGMRVLRFHSNQHWETPVDFFVEEPFPFEKEYAKAEEREFADGVAIRVVTLKTLSRMKQEAGRPKDLADLSDLASRKKSRGKKS
ncbi:MAG: nucleotidyl transferase AbiEii/AbiGii toxin family protein [Bdellovibrionota bacterium]